MSCTLTEEDLWSGIDRAAPEIAEHLETCPVCRERAAQMQAGMDLASSVLRPHAVTDVPMPVRIGSYLIRRRLGQGGMGIVYEGEQQAPRRLVAIKVVRGGEYDEYRLRLFQREAETLALLKHPSIAAVYEGGRTEEGQHFFAMELVRGMPLNEFVRTAKVARRQRLQLFGQVCEAINYAHQRGVIHRDLKPTNILVEADGRPKILDFGLARITDPDGAMMTTMHDVGQIMGTLPYMSPEAARGHVEEIDVRSDVYSLGVMFYELLTDQLPYAVSRAALPEGVRVICEEAPRRPASIDRSLRGDLDTMALKALEKDPGRRYQSAAAFGEDVQRYLSNEPILARRASHWYQLRKFLARNKLLMLILCTLAGLMIGAAVWVNQIEKELRAGTQFNADLQDLRAAVVGYSLGKSLHDLRDYGRAEQEYRTSLATFQRLDREDYTAKARLSLGQLLVDRGDAEEMLQAERTLLDALLFFDQKPTAWAPERLQALEALQRLYGPDRLNDPAGASNLEREIDALRRFLSARALPEEDEAAPPDQQRAIHPATPTQ